MLSCSWSNICREGLSHEGRQAFTPGRLTGTAVLLCRALPNGPHREQALQHLCTSKGWPSCQSSARFLLCSYLCQEIETLDKLFRSGDFYKTNYMQISSTLTCQHYGWTPVLTASSQTNILTLSCFLHGAGLKYLETPIPPGKLLQQELSYALHVLLAQVQMCTCSSAVGLPEHHTDMQMHDTTSMPGMRIKLCGLHTS